MISTKSLPLLVLLQLASVGSISLAYSYDRLSEIEKQCGPYLSSALELSHDHVQEYNLKDELSFFNGEWEQEPGGASPLMSFDDNDMFWDWFSYADPLRSVSLEITKQDSSLAPDMHVSVLVGGVLSIGIHRKGRLGFEKMGLSNRPGYSSLVMEVEGLYIETKEKGAERLLCLLGNTRNSPTSHIAIFGDQPESEARDLVHVLLRYPRKFDMTSLAITGEILSLSPHDAGDYFDPVRVTSQLSHLLSYQFNGIADSRDLHESRYQDHSIERDSIDLLDSRKFCRNLLNTQLIRFSFEEDYYKVDGESGNGMIGPFFLGKEDENKQSWQHEGFNIILKPIKCDNEFGKVAVVLRVIPESMDQETAVSRTGISGATMIAEGIWDPLSRQLSMVGCAGGNHPDLESRCNSRILLHFPETLSLTQRSVITGNISRRNRIDDMEDSFSPLRISTIVGPEELVNYYWYPAPCDYDYSVARLAYEFWERRRTSLRFNFISPVMNKAFLRYPAFGSQALQGSKLFASLSRLSKELNFHTRCFPIELRKYHKTMYFLQAEILSLGPLCGPYNPHQYDDTMTEDKASVQAKSWVVNASVHLTFTVDEDVFTGRMEKCVTYLFLEGVYDASIGEMNLVGCGDVDVGRSFYVTGPYVDCLMAARMRYSPVNIRWLKNPTLEIAIMSLRNETDPLYFEPFTLRKISVYTPNPSTRCSFPDNSGRIC